MVDNPNPDEHPCETTRSGVRHPDAAAFFDCQTRYSSNELPSELEVRGTVRRGEAITRPVSGRIAIDPTCKFRHPGVRFVQNLIRLQTAAPQVDMPTSGMPGW